MRLGGRGGSGAEGVGMGVPGVSIEVEKVRDRGCGGSGGRREEEKGRLADGNKKPVDTGSRYIGPLFNPPLLSSSLFSTTSVSLRMG